MDFSGALRLGVRELVSFVGAGGKKTAMARLVDEGSDQERAVGYTTTTKMPPPPIPLLVDEPTKIVKLLDTIKLPRAFARRWIDDPARVDRKLDGYSTEAVERIFDASRLDWLVVKADGARMREVKAPARDEPVVPPTTTHVVAVMSVEAVGRPLDAETVHRPDRVAAITDTAIGEVVTPSTLAALLASPDAGRRNVPETARLTPMVNKADTPAERDAGREVIERLLARTDVVDAGLVTSFETGRVDRIER